MESEGPTTGRNGKGIAKWRDERETVGMNGV